MPMEFFIFEKSIFDLLEGVLYVTGTVFALILVALSISAYRNTGLRKLVYIMIAFLLFGTFLFFEYLEHATNWDHPLAAIILPGMCLSSLVLFFLAVVHKK
jgi:hypothetical protein